MLAAKTATSAAKESTDLFDVHDDEKAGGAKSTGGIGAPPCLRAREGEGGNYFARAVKKIQRKKNRTCELT